MMSGEAYRYCFPSEVLLEEVEATLVLALFAAESIRGESQVRLDAAHHFDLERRVCVIDASTTVGRTLNRLFVGLLTREFGPHAFQVERIEMSPESQPAAMVADACAPHPRANGLTRGP